MGLSLIYVWYNERYFLLDDLYFPYISNLKFNSKYRKSYVFYYIREPDCLEAAKKYIHDNNTYNIHYCNFEDVFHQFIPELLALKNNAQKIDFMKLIILCHCFDVLDKENDILVLDFDCHIGNVKEKIYNVEPFYCKDIDQLNTSFYDYGTLPNCIRSSESCIEKDSYIENYATRIDRLGSKRLLNIFNRLGRISSENDGSNSYVYMIYVFLIISYFKKYENYTFPNRYKDLTLESSIDISYYRGSTWKIDCGNIGSSYNKQVDSSKVGSSWIIRYRKPFNEDIKSRVYNCILFDKFLEFYIILLEEVNFPFEYNMFWINDKQRYGTLREMILERIKPSSRQAAYIYLVDKAIKSQNMYAKYQYY